MVSEIDQIRNKSDFTQFLHWLAEDFQNHSEEWSNRSVPEFLERIASWIEDFSDCPMNDIQWDGFDFKALARMFYMGKLYE